MVHQYNFTILGNEKRKQMYIKNGAGENTYGVLLGELRKLANQFGTNHELAFELPALRRQKREETGVII